MYDNPPLWSNHGIGNVLRYSVTDAGEVRVDASGVSTCYWRLKVEMSSLNDNETALRIGLPWYQKYQPHPNQALYGTENNLYVSEFQAVQVKNTTWWDVQVTYTDELVANPLAQAAVIGEVQTYTMPAGTILDGEGNAILNTAGEPPEPFDKPERILQITIIKNVPATIQSWLFDFEDCVNSDSVQLDAGISAEPYTLLINSIRLQLAH